MQLIGIPMQGGSHITTPPCGGARMWCEITQSRTDGGTDGLTSFEFGGQRGGRSNGTSAPSRPRAHTRPAATYLLKEPVLRWLGSRVQIGENRGHARR